MKQFKTDPIGAAMGALIIVGAVGLVASLPTVAQPPAGQGGRRGANSPAAPGGQWRGPDGPGGGERKAVGPMLSHILQNLTLTEKQKSQAEALMENERVQMEKIHEQVRQIHQQTRTRLNALLTAEQRKQLEAQEEMCQNGPGGGPGGGRPDGPPPGSPPGGYGRGGR